jgi:hypothetical protein
MSVQAYNVLTFMQLPWYSTALPAIRNDRDNCVDDRDNYRNDDSKTTTKMTTTAVTTPQRQPQGKDRVNDHVDDRDNNATTAMTAPRR